MNWFKSFWKKLTAPPAEKPPTVRDIFGGSEPAGQRLTGEQFKAEQFGNFTPRAHQVLALARKEAERLNHSFVGTEHVLLGLAKLGQGVSVNVLQKQGVDLLTLRAEVEKQVGTGPEQKLIGNIPYTPRVIKVLDFAKKEARALNHTYVGTEHILLGLLRDSEGVAGRILRNLGVDVEQTRQEILKELDPNYTSAGGQPPTKSPVQPESATSRLQAEEVDTSKRYDVYCTDWSQGVTIYKNVRFKGVKHLFQRSAYDVLSGYVELEQENGQSVFVSRGTIIKFTGPGT